MNTIGDWDQEILSITMKIRSDFPELTKYLEETPINFQHFEGINKENLEEYSKTLHQLFNSYAHQRNQQNKL